MDTDLLTPSDGALAESAAHQPDRQDRIPAIAAKMPSIVPMLPSAETMDHGRRWTPAAAESLLRRARRFAGCEVPVAHGIRATLAPALLAHT